MIVGKVTEAWEPVVDLGCVLRDTTRDYQAVIDTGFNGYLSVPVDIVAQSNWLLLGRERYELADGRPVIEAVYLAQVMFDDTSFHVLAVATTTDEILIGTRFLARKRLVIDFATKLVTVTDAQATM